MVPMFASLLTCCISIPACPLFCSMIDLSRSAGSVSPAFPLAMPPSNAGPGRARRALALEFEDVGLVPAAGLVPDAVRV
jgi:hypothetical protein